MLITVSTLFYGQSKPIQIDETVPEHVHTHCSAPHSACESLLVVAQDRGRPSSPDETRQALSFEIHILFLVRKQLLKQDN